MIAKHCTIVCERAGKEELSQALKQNRKCISRKQNALNDGHLYSGDSYSFP